MTVAAPPPPGPRPPSSTPGPASEPEGWTAPLLVAVQTLARTRGAIEARLAEAARVLVATCGDQLLGTKGFTSIEELTASQRRKWRAEAKAAAVDELIATLGLSQTEARELVGIALAGGTVPALVIAALEEGRVPGAAASPTQRATPTTTAASATPGTTAVTTSPHRF